MINLQSMSKAVYAPLPVANINKSLDIEKKPFKTNNNESSSKMNRNIKIAGGIVGGLVFLIGVLKYGKNIFQSKKNVENIKNNQAIDEMKTFIENYIKMVKPKDENTAKEVLPTLLKFTKELGLEENIKNIELFINQVTAENKEFALKSGIKILAENMGKIKSITTDSDKAYKILGFIDETNVGLLPRLMQNHEALKIKKVGNINYYLSSLQDKKADFAFNETLPLLLKHQNKLKIDKSMQIADILEHTTPETKDIIGLIGDSADKLKLDEFSRFILAVNSDNKKNAEFILKNLNKLKIADTDDFKTIQNLLNKSHEELSNLINTKV